MGAGGYTTEMNALGMTFGDLWRGETPCGGVSQGVRKGLKFSCETGGETEAASVAQMSTGGNGRL